MLDLFLTDVPDSCEQPARQYLRFSVDVRLVFKDDLGLLERLGSNFLIDECEQLLIFMIQTIYLCITNKYEHNAQQAYNIYLLDSDMNYCYPNLKLKDLETV